MNGSLWRQPTILATGSRTVAPSLHRVSHKLAAPGRGVRSGRGNSVVTGRQIGIAGLSRRPRRSRGRGRHSPACRETETRDAIDAEQEAAGPCRETRRGRRTRRHGNCILGAARSNAGSHRPRRGTAGRPAKLTQTPARAADAAPGAADSSGHPPKKTSRGAPGTAPAHGASGGLQLAELLNTRPLTGPREAAIAFRRGRTLPGRLPGMARSPSETEVAVRDLNYDLKRLQAAHDDGSHGTRSTRSTRWRRSPTPCTISASRACGRPG